MIVGRAATTEVIRCGGTLLRSVYREERVLGWIDVAETAIGRGFVLDWQRFVE